LISFGRIPVISNPYYETIYATDFWIREYENILEFDYTIQNTFQIKIISNF